MAAFTGTNSISAALPLNWSLTNGYLVGPTANLSNIANGSTLSCSQAGYCGSNPNGSLNGLNLRGVNMSDSAIAFSPSHTDFSGANFRNTTWVNFISWCNFSNANFTNASLISETFDPWNVYHTLRLDHSYFVGANFTDATLARTSFDYSNFTNVDLSVANIDMSQTTFISADLGGANLSGLSLYDTDFTNATMVVANLSGADLTAANLSGANLTGANLTGANLTGANLSGAITTYIVGVPSSLPAGWKLVGTALVHAP